MSSEQQPAERLSFVGSDEDVDAVIELCDGDARARSAFRVKLIHEAHRDVRLHHAGKLLGVPVRQADAAVRRCLAHLGRLGCSVDAEGWLRQCDPDRTYRIVWARRQSELPLVAALLEVFLGVVVVGRLAYDPLDSIFAFG